MKFQHYIKPHKNETITTKKENTNQEIRVTVPAKRKQVNA